MATLRWNGPQISAQTAGRALKAVDETMLDCVAHAQQPPPVGAPRDTGFLANTIEVVERARIDSGGRIVGRWGNATADYALAQETKNTFLRRAADKIYPSLSERMREQ